MPRSFRVTAPSAHAKAAATAPPATKPIHGVIPSFVASSAEV